MIKETKISFRQQAEEQIKKRYSSKNTPPGEADAIKLIHELEVHQIELEMQNEELILAEEKAKSATEKFTTLFDFAPMGYFTLDLDGTIYGLNFSGAKMLGNDRSGLVNKNFKIYVEPDSVPVFSDFLQKVFETDSKQTCELRLRNQENSLTCFYLEGIIWEREQKCLVTAVDMTERRQAEDALKESERLLRELNATKDKFFFIIAHDLKGPFSNILSFSNILVDQINKKDYTGIDEYAMIMQKSAQRAMNLLVNLLEWTLSQTGKMSYNPENIEIVSLINEIAETSDDSALTKSISISRKLPNNATIFADKAMISAVLRNLISNAIKFTNSGGEIIVSLTQKQGEVMVSVRDNGVGIKKESIKKLFRIEESFTTKGTKDELGTGLGLLLCQDFISKHNGKIWVESELGKGSTFYFTIPKK